MFNKREMGAILAGLRQIAYMESHVDDFTLADNEIATNNGEFEPLTPKEIDRLYDRIVAADSTNLITVLELARVTLEYDADFFGDTLHLAGDEKAGVLSWIKQVLGEEQAET